MYKRSESNLLPPIVRFDRIDGSYDDSNKPKMKNPQKHSYFDKLSERHAIREGSYAIQVKRATVCEESTVSHEQTYGLLRLDLLSLTVGFDRIDVAVKKTMNQTLKAHRSVHA